MGKRILLADDSVTIQKVVELTFLDEDFEVVAVSNGDDALARLGEVRPDVVIADVHMPGANGYEVCQGVKAWRSGTPVVLLVGTFEPFDESRARSAGANYYLKKPFDSQELLQQVEGLLAASAAAAATSAPEAPAIGAAADEMEPWQGGDDLALPEEEELYGAAAVPAEPGPEPTPAFGGQPVPEELVLEPSPWTEAEELDESPWEAVAGEPAASAPPAMAAGAAAVAGAAGWAAATPAAEQPPATLGNGGLSDEEVERIARRVVELIGDRLVREVAWEVIPDMAELVIKDRVRELERQLEGP